MLPYIGREDDRVKARANFDRVLEGESFTLIEAYGDEARGRRFFEDVYSPIFGPGGEVAGLTLYLTDITEQRRTQEELAQHRLRLEALVDERTAELHDAHARLLHAQKLESLG